MKGIVMLKYLKPKFRYIILGLLSILFLSAVGYYGCQEYTLYNIKSNLGATNAVAAHNNGYGACNTDPNATLPQLGVSGEICGADNSILVLSKASKYFGYRLGDEVTVNVFMMAPNSYTFNFAPLYAGTFNVYGSEFKLLNKPSVDKVTSGKNTYYEITFKAISFMANVKNPPLAFTATLPYAVLDKKTATGYDYGLILTTPVMISVSNTFGYGASPLPGSYKPMVNYGSSLAIGLLVLGFVLSLTSCIQAILTYVANYVAKTKPLSSSYIAWQVFDGYFKADVSFDSRVAGFVSHALRQYFGVLGKTATEIEASQIDPSIKGYLVNVVRVLDGAVFARFELTAEDRNYIINIVNKIVPRDNTFESKTRSKPKSVWTPFAGIVSTFKTVKVKLATLLKTKQ